MAYKHVEACLTLLLVHTNIQKTKLINHPRSILINHAKSIYYEIDIQNTKQKYKRISDVFTGW